MTLALQRVDSRASWSCEKTLNSRTPVMQSGFAHSTANGSLWLRPVYAGQSLLTVTARRRSICSRKAKRCRRSRSTVQCNELNPWCVRWCHQNPSASSEKDLTRGSAFRVTREPLALFQASSVFYGAMHSSLISHNESSRSHSLLSCCVWAIL